MVLIIQGLLFLYHDLYRGLWRYVSFADLQNILRATLMSLILLTIMDFFFSRYLGTIPRSIYVLDWLLVVVFTGGCRFMVRHIRERAKLLAEKPRALRVMLVGPMEATEPLLREMVSHGNTFLPVIVVDPDAQFRGYRVYDTPIIGLRQIAKALDRYRVQEIIFAWPDAPQDQLNEIIEECKRWQVKVKIIPSISEVLGGHFRLADARDIELEDLLARPPIYIEREQIADFIRDRVILVTGGGGSIGSELCRQVANYQPRSLVLLERAENSLYETEMSLRRRFPELDLHALVASINDGPGLEILFQHYRPQVIFHAAAYKHVPLMERYPVEAAYNNILGTRKLVKAALSAASECFVMISTDKAVNPTSIMGVSKRIAEKYVQASNNHSATRFLTTRFGNVLGSAGSVIPIFKEQLAQGGPLTVTHPEIERFFMTIPEAVQLVLQAACMGQGGDIFVFKMGRLVKIRELAEKLIMLARRTPGEDVPIIYTGLRPGEKLYEELFNDDEEPRPTAHPMLSCAMGPQEDIEVWEAHLRDIQALVDNRDSQGLIDKFRLIIPNYRHYQYLDDKKD
ncbi:MAG: nucleoside-diphosphate sugar epimerase/dehydratase [Desulfobaccales bacterium]|nr:nucleoside-diphosphate sugar epimerase/dehydratase [Desulfobaccales bacterium]